MRKIINKRFIKYVFSLLFVLGLFLVQDNILAADYGLDATVSSDDNTKVLKDTGDVGVAKLIGRIVGAGLALIGSIFLALIIYGGFLWMTDRGNEDHVKKAKDLITAAVIGLIIVLAAYAITAYIGGALI